ncbi:MAG: glycosyltransferase family 4 protein [Candidatus Buchananbacteria bacterium]
MKKTLLITCFFPPQIGGIENYFHNLCSRMEPDKIAVLTQNDQNAKQFDGDQKYPIYRTEFFDGKFPPRWRSLKGKIKKIIKDQGIEQIAFGHFHFFNLLGPKLGLPYVNFGHGTDIASVGAKFGSKLAFKRVYRSSKAFIANSQFLAQKIAELSGDSTKIKTIYGGVDVEALNIPITDIDGKKKLIGLEENDLVMLSMGRLVEIKNYSGIIKLMPAILQIIPNLKYVIVGGGPQYLELVELASHVGVSNNVKFIGAIPDDPASKSFYYQIAHIFVGISKVPEGLGISYLEAQACRTPVIASNSGGAAEAVINGDTGILVDANNDNEIVKAIISLSQDRELWTKLADSGQKRMGQVFDLKAQIEKIKEVLN